MRGQSRVRPAGKVEPAEGGVALRGLSIFASLMVLAGSAVFAAAGTSDVTDPPGIAPSDSALASKAEQLAAVKRSIAEAECDFAVDAAIIEACDFLQAQANILEGEIEALKAQAAKPVEQTAIGSPRAKPYSFAARTNPNVSYRTFCVRECDGFYYPLSEAVKPGAFVAEEAKCRAGCSSPARLFYAPAMGADAVAMTALTGERYGDLANAFRFRSEYVAACTCKPMPWTAEAKAAFARRAVLATRTPSELIVAEGTGEVAKLLAGGDVTVAARVTLTKRRHSRAVAERTGARPFLFRSFRNALGLGVLALAEPAPQRHVFRFRGRD